MVTIPESITDRESAVAFIEWCVNTLGLGYHPDTPFTEYLNRYDGVRCFTDAEAAALDELQEKAFVYCDPYKEGTRLFADIFAFPPPEGDGGDLGQR